MLCILFGKLNILCAPFFYQVSMNLIRLEEELKAIIEREQGKDLTLQMQMMFDNVDRHIVKAQLTNDPILVMIIGLRSEVLSPFERFTEDSEKFMPCDIPGLVPVVALMSDERLGLDISAITRDENVTRIVLGFDGSDGMEIIARRVLRFMTRWKQWTDVLLNALSHDPFVDEWKIDWREFLAGESGYVTMNWYNPIEFSERAVGLARVVETSIALLNSVLNPNQMQHSLVRDLVRWLKHLEPLPTIIGSRIDILEKTI